MNRRQFFALSAGVALMPFASSHIFASHTRQRFISAYQQDDRHFLGILDDQLTLLGSIELAWRGHGLAYNPHTQQAILFARRPGTKAAIIDLATHSVKTEIKTPDGRHFYGHGCFSQDGRYCYTTENDYESARGVIGVWHTKTWQRVNEWHSGGTGPHDVHLMPDGKTLVIANGGIQTHPDYGRRKLNIDHMDSSLVYLDVRTGRLSEKYTIAYPYLSLRHLHVNRRGTVAIAMQSQQPDARVKPREPLLAVHRRGQPIKVLHAPSSIQEKLQGYAADVVLTDDDSRFVLTCPRANKAVIWGDTGHGERVTAYELDGVSGVSQMAAAGQILLSGDSGHLALLDMRTGSTLARQQINHQWDNHALSYGLN